jgi:ParB family chromosome partitioning protein
MVAGEVRAARDIPIDRIGVNPFQPRLGFDENKLRELADSIREHGVVQPVLVRPRGGDYQLVAGERRLRAARQAGLAAIPAVVREMSDHEIMEIALIENIQRQDLDPVEEARAYKRLADEFGQTQEQIAERLSKSRSYIANSMRLLRLPLSVQEQLAGGALTVGHVRPLLTLPAAAAEALARRILASKATAREAEAWARQLSKGGEIGDADADNNDDYGGGAGEDGAAGGMGDLGGLDGMSGVGGGYGAGIGVGIGVSAGAAGNVADSAGGVAGDAAGGAGGSYGLGAGAGSAGPGYGPGAGPGSAPGGPGPGGGGPRPELPVELREIQRAIRERVNTKVDIVQTAKGGKVIIDYYSQDDLERILELFTGTIAMP